MCIGWFGEEGQARSLGGRLCGLAAVNAVVPSDLGKELEIFHFDV